MTDWHPPTAPSEKPLLRPEGPAGAGPSPRKVGSEAPFLACSFFPRALQFPPEGWLRLSLNNGSITHLVVRPDGRVALRALGDTGFMPPDKISRS